MAPAMPGHRPRAATLPGCSQGYSEARAAEPCKGRPNKRRCYFCPTMALRLAAFARLYWGLFGGGGGEGVRPSARGFSPYPSTPEAPRSVGAIPPPRIRAAELGAGRSGGEKGQLLQNGGLSRHFSFLQKRDESSCLWMGGPPRGLPYKGELLGSGVWRLSWRWRRRRGGSGMTQSAVRPACGTPRPSRRTLPCTVCLVLRGV